MAESPHLMKRSELATSPDAGPLDGVRAELDAINRKLLALLEERGRVVLRVMEIKQRHRLPTHDARRESQMCARLVAESQGVYPPQAIERVFQCIFEASRNLALRPDSAR